MIHELHMIFTQQRIDYWIHYNLVTWQWYFLMAILLLPWFFWWKIVDKKRLLSIIIMGLIVSVTANWMDQVGAELGWWDYAYNPLPFFPQMLPVNYTLLPIGYMLLYQYYTAWQDFIRMVLIMAAVLSWMFEPIFSWMGVYQLFTWHYSYSFPIYVFIAVSHKWLVDQAFAAANGKS